MAEVAQAAVFGAGDRGLVADDSILRTTGEHRSVNFQSPVPIQSRPALGPLPYVGPATWSPGETSRGLGSPGMSIEGNTVHNASDMPDLMQLSKLQVWQASGTPLACGRSPLRVSLLHPLPLTRYEQGPTGLCFCVQFGQLARFRDWNHVFPVGSLSGCLVGMHMYRCSFHYILAMSSCVVVCVAIVPLPIDGAGRGFLNR